MSVEETGPRQSIPREEQLLKKIAVLEEKLKRAEDERDVFRTELIQLSQEHRKVLSDSSRLQVKLGRAAMNSSDSYHAKVAELIDAKANFSAIHELQRAKMTDERRVSEDQLQSIIEEKLNIISEQVEEIKKMKLEVEPSTLPVSKNDTKD